ncbi:MAG: cysteine dioxygenase family protein [Gammaproteobacteria bacterium]|nr:cysteine dioxygenase family protein [Gammaproteobacteria bacterium]
MANSYSLDHYIEDLKRITADARDEDSILTQLGPLSARLALDKGWLRDKYFETDEEQGFAAHLLHEESDHSLAVFAVSWIPGRGAPPHDHGTWAVVSGVEGIERNIGYSRADDRSQPGHAELEVKHDFNAGPGELVCMKTGGIHAVRNESDQVTLSLHTYGMHVNHTNRSQFDLKTNEEKSFVVTVA